MSIDPRAIADETGVPEEDVLAVLDALDEADDGGTEDEDKDGDDRSAVEERTPEDIIETHETFIEERDVAEPSASSAKSRTEVGHHDPDVQRHRENVARLIDADRNQNEGE